jgi:hypothetical protein
VTTVSTVVLSGPRRRTFSGYTPARVRRLAQPPPLAGPSGPYRLMTKPDCTGATRGSPGRSMTGKVPIELRGVPSRAASSWAWVVMAG